MSVTNKLMLFAAGASLAVAGAAWSQSHHRAAAGASDAALIRSAMSAAPAAVARDANIVVVSANGTSRNLRHGNNGFTCMPDNPATPGPDPMCMDANAVEWGMAWIQHRTPPPNNVGLMYMLAGGSDASNVDPYSERPTRGAPWLHTGPHVMIVGSDSLLRNYPSGPAPDTSRPYVMFAGTPYAHLMIPVR
jgi:hypothetical protein